MTKFIFHKENVLVEADKDFNAISRFTRGCEVIAADIAELDGDINTEVESKLSRYFYTVDEQGSTVFITDNDQQVKNEYWYDTFGNVLDSKEKVHNRITYIDQQFDGITGQYYLRARFYNPVIGRFTQDDIYRGYGLNLYAYCGNNSVVYYDPNGFVFEGKANQYNKEVREFDGNREEYLRQKYRNKYGEEFNAEKLHHNINERSGIEFSPRAENSYVKNGGYKTNDIDKHKKNSLDDNPANEYSSSKADGQIQSHHLIQDQWAKQWAKRNGISYSQGNVPGILLRRNSGEAHAQLSALQRARRRTEGYNTNIVHEFNIGYKEMIQSGVNSKDAKKAIREAYRYFDNLGGV